MISVFAGYGLAQNPTATDEERVRGVVRQFAEARNVHDGQSAAAMYLPDGEYIDNVGNRTKGREALAKLWGGLDRTITRTITSVELITPDLAVVRVIAEFPEFKTRLAETYLLIRDDGKWGIRVHQALRLTPGQ